MKLDRNTSQDRPLEFALLKIRDFDVKRSTVDGVTLIPTSAIDFGETSDTEFVVIRLRDKYAAPALAAFAMAAYQDDPEYGLKILNLAKKAAEHPAKHRPD